MKRMFLISALALLMAGGMWQNAAAQKTTKYYVAYGWLENGATEEKRPFVTNVVSVSCENQSTHMVKNQFYDFYKAFVGKKHKGFSVTDNQNSAYDTREKAEKKRREMIAMYNENWDTCLIHDFSVLCDDDD